MPSNINNFLLERQKRIIKYEKDSQLFNASKNFMRDKLSSMEAMGSSLNMKEEESLGSVSVF